jgi:hypothetical protein
MKFVLVAILAMAPLAAAEATTKPAAPAKQAAAPKPIEIPKGAVEVSPGTYTFTDAAGKKWLYRKTPFGVARLEDKGEQKAAAEVAAPKAKVTAVEEGDVVHFERPGPFGMYRWDRKKSELSEDEKGWLEASRAGSRQTARQD